MDEKLKNLIIYKVYATDKERDELFGVAGLILIVCVVIAAIGYGIGWLLGLV